jgi:hypothetical protein
MVKLADLTRFQKVLKRCMDTKKTKIPTFSEFGDREKSGDLNDKDKFKNDTTRRI